MYAIIQPNMHAFPHNSPSFSVTIFDEDGTRIDSRVVMEGILPPFAAEHQAISMLGRYTAGIDDVERCGDGFRVNNLRPQ